MPSLQKSKAWKMLREEEQLALNLKLIQKKSTWEAGEVMRRSHYKYLEIVGRAQFFLKRFTEHFDKFENKLVPEDVELNPAFREYLELTICGRKSQREALNLLMEHRFAYDGGFRVEFIATEMNRLANSKKTIEKYFHNLIMDFDRWNNFRILPISIQEPHAFKRRQKNRLKKYLLKSCKLGEKTFNYIIKELRHKGRIEEDNLMWVYAIKNIHTQEYKVIPVKKTNRNIEILSQYGIFLFSRKDQCEEMLRAIAGYFRVIETSNVIKGQTFWPLYRDLISISINGNSIENISPNRKEYITYINQDKLREQNALKKSRNMARRF